MSQGITLYDLPSKAPCRSWSGNAWKTRLALNFKGVPYKTKWIPYTQLQETLEATGLGANPPGSWSDYSVPTIRWSDGSYLMDPAAIAVKLDSLHPSPPLYLNPELENEASAAMSAVFRSIIPFFATIVIRNLVAEEDVGWFKADRASRFGWTIEEMMTERDANAAYPNAKPGFEKCREVLRVHKKDDGPFILGSVPCYADFYLVSTMQMYRQAGEEVFERFLDEAGLQLRELYAACEKWTSKQD